MASRRSLMRRSTREKTSATDVETCWKMRTLRSRQMQYTITCNISFSTASIPAAPASWGWAITPASAWIETGASRTGLAENLAQIAATKGHWKKRWEWDSVPKRQRTHWEESLLLFYYIPKRKIEHKRPDNVYFVLTKKEMFILGEKKRVFFYEIIIP